MSLKYRRSTIVRLQSEIATLNKKLADEGKKEVSKQNEINRIQRSITSTVNSSILLSKKRQITRLSDEIAKIQKSKADLLKKISDKQNLLFKEQEALTKEEEREQKKIVDAEKRRQKEQLEHQRKLNRELRDQYRLTNQLKPSSTAISTSDNQYDAFISHASEDKDEFVRPLAQALEEEGFRVWYDEFSLKVGDSLRRSIDKGLSESRYGIVILSTAFFEKNWPQYELDGLVAKEMGGHKVILPIWHRISKDDVIKYSPSIADKIALNSSLSTIKEIVSQLGEVLKIKT